MPSPIRHRRQCILVMVGFWLVVLAVAIRWTMHKLEPWLTQGRSHTFASVSLDPADLHDGDPHPFFAQGQFVWDDATFVRPQENCDTTLRVSLFDGTATEYVMRHVEHGLVRAELLSSATASRRVLLVGDSHMYGVASPRDNIYRFLEDGLAATEVGPVDVLNGSCICYTAYQYYLVVRKLTPVVKPDCVVAVIYVGNDLLESDDVTRPHLDDLLAEHDAASSPPPETTSGRQRRFERLVGRRWGGLFWQSFNQLIYFDDHPDRVEPTLGKTVGAMRLLASWCDENEMPLLVAVLPTYGDVVDSRYPFSVPPEVGQLLERAVDRDLRVRLVEQLAATGLNVVDLQPPLRAADSQNLYAADFHLWTDGHRVAANSLAPMLEHLLQDAPGVENRSEQGAHSGP